MISMSSAVLPWVFVVTTLIAWLVLESGRVLLRWYREVYTEELGRRFARQFVFVDVDRMFLLTLAGAAVAALAVYLLSRSVWAASGVAVMMLFLPRTAGCVLNHRRQRQVQTSLPDSLQQLASAMRAGATLTTATEHFVRDSEGPLGQELSLVLREQRLGEPVERSWRNMAARNPGEAMELVVAAVLVARESGGNLAEIFDTLAQTLREKQAMDGKVRALTSQGKLQGWIVGLLPVLMIGALSLLEPQAMKPLFSSVMGWSVLLLMGVLELIGMLMIRKIVMVDV